MKGQLLEEAPKYLPFTQKSQSPNLEKNKVGSACG